MTVRVDPDAFYQAGWAADAARARAADGVATVSAELFDSAGMAGSDASGRTWATGYDNSARALMSVSSDMVTGLEHMTYLLNRTGENYDRAERSSAVVGFAGPRTMLGAGNPRSVGRGGDGSPSLSLAQPPTAAGGSGGGPPGWHLVEGRVGYVWPNGHQDKLRRTAAVWTRGSMAVGEARLSRVYASLTNLSCPELGGILTVNAELDAHVVELSQAYAAVGQACSDYADHLDQAHHEVSSELQALVAETVALSAGGALLTAVSAGLSDAAAATAIGVRCALVAGRVGSILGRLLATAARIGEQVAQASARAAEISRSIRSFLQVRIAAAAVRTVPRLGRIARLGRRVKPVAGLDDAASAFAFEEMRIKGAHAMQHLIDEGLIPNVGTVEQRAVAFQDITGPILRQPLVRFHWRLYDTSTTAYGGMVGDQHVVVFVARHGKWADKVISAVVPDSRQLIEWGLI